MEKKSPNLELTLEKREEIVVRRQRVVILGHDCRREENDTESVAESLDEFRKNPITNANEGQA